MLIGSWLCAHWLMVVCSLAGLYVQANYSSMPVEFMWEHNTCLRPYKDCGDPQLLTRLVEAGVEVLSPPLWLLLDNKGHRMVPSPTAQWLNNLTRSTAPLNLTLVFSSQMTSQCVTAGTEKASTSRRLVHGAFGGPGAQIMKQGPPWRTLPQSTDRVGSITRVLKGCQHGNCQTRCWRSMWCVPYYLCCSHLV